MWSEHQHLLIGSQRGHGALGTSTEPRQLAQRRRARVGIGEDTRGRGQHTRQLGPLIGLAVEGLEGEQGTVVCRVDRANLLEARDGAPQVPLMIAQDLTELHEQGDAVGRVHGEIHSAREILAQLAVFSAGRAQAYAVR